MRLPHCILKNNAFLSVQQIAIALVPVPDLCDGVPWVPSFVGPFLDVQKLFISTKCNVESLLVGISSSLLRFGKRRTFKVKFRNPAGANPPAVKIHERMGRF